MRFLLPFLLALGCLQTGVRAPMTPDSVAQATYKVETRVVVVTPNGDEQITMTGTAWLARAGNAPDLITAGHVCAPEVSVMGVPLPIKYTHLALVDRRGVRIMVAVRVVDRENDLCLLTALVPMTGALELAQADPAYGTPVMYVGAPLGIWGAGMAPLYRGDYAGGDLVTVPTAGGASGSAVLSSEGVIGVLVRVRTGFPQAAYIVPLADLRAFLAANNP
jgi:hypothetical protein